MAELSDYGELSSFDLPIDSTKLIGDCINFNGPLIMIHSNAPIELRRNITAATVAYFQGYSSIDYVLNTYSELCDLQSSFDGEYQLCLEMLQKANNKIMSIIEWLNSVEDKPSENPGLFFAEMALVRLQSGFSGASFLISQGYYFETLSICRQILEQIAWAYSIHEVDDIEKIKKTEPNNCIGQLKSLIPKAGKLNGRLCDATHIAPKLTPKYISFVQGCPAVNLLGSEEGRNMIWYLLSLVDYFSIVSEYIHRERAFEFSSLIADQNGRYYLNENRLFLNIIRQLESLNTD